MRCSIVVACCVVLGLTTRARAEGQPEPIVIIGLRPATGSFEGNADLRRLSEAQRLRKVVDDVVRDLAHRPIIDDAGLRTVLGTEYLVDFMDCRSEVACVAKLVRKLKTNVGQGVYGEYTVVDHDYRIRVHLLDLKAGKNLHDVEFKLEESDVTDRKLWRRELESLFSSGGAPEVTPTKPPPPDGNGAGSGSGSGSGSASEDNGVPELAPITSDTEGGGSSTSGPKGGGDSKPFVDTSVLDAVSRGIAWHGHFQNYSAMGVRSGFKRDVVTFDDRLQLEFESDINQVRVVGKPQLLFDVLDDTLQVHFREMYAARDYKRVDVAVGEQIATWGVTDFWPVVDILNPRDYSVIRNWRPIDEKLPVPMLKTTWLFGPVTFHLIGVPILGQSAYQLDPTQPFALPVPAPPGVAVMQKKLATRLSNAGGGTRIDFAVKSWKLSLYGLIGRDPMPSIYAQTDVTSMQTTFYVENDRVAMGAASLVGSLDSVGALIKAEAAYYHRLDNECEGMILDIMGLPQCLYIHRVPTARTNISIERRLFPGLEAHLQFITEITSSKDIPRLPPTVLLLSPGLPEQYPLNKIFTLRLQGNFAKGDFVPMAFVYWSLDDEAFFINTDFDYHLADGFSLALGGFWFDGYASNPNKNRYTLAGSFAPSSNVYLRATAWF